MKHNDSMRAFPLVVSLLITLALTVSCVTVVMPAAKETSPASSTGRQVTAPQGTTRGPTGTISTGPEVDIATQNISPSGGVVEVTKPGDPLDGFVISVPPNSYADSRTFKVSSAPITRQTFGDDIDPISPMITVENGGGYADGVMYVRVPVKVPEDSFAMGFIYDEKTGQLTGIPLATADAESVTLAATHFCSFFISKIKKALLQNGVDSGFRPGIDDWQFRNDGSYIARGGHCEGQALTALWYYCTQPDGKDMCLYGRYDNNGNQPATPDLWQDDSLGYRFCSVIQEEKRFGVGPSLEDFWENLAGRDWDGKTGKWVDVPAALSDELTFYVFAYTIKVSRQPQEVGIWSNAGGGHAMIVYKVVGNALYIADPNYPGNTDRKIIFYAGEGKFKPYQSGANRKEIEKGNTKSYEKIIFLEKSTIVPWDTIARRWAELKNGTIGNDKFPAYEIVYKDDAGKWQELKDGYVSPVQKIEIQATGNPMPSTAVFRDGAWLPKGEKELKPGNNTMGIFVMAEVDGSQEYVDFQYINVIYSSFTIEPPMQEGEPGRGYVFRAKAEGAPDKARYEWTVNGMAQAAQSSVVTLNIGEAGTYNITCKLYDAAKPGSKAIAEASATLLAREEAYITLQIPSGEQGPDVKYVFPTEHGTVPAGAVYSWFVDGQKKMEAVDGNRLTADPGFFKPGSYQIEVVARWLDEGKKEQSVRDGGIFTVKAKAQEPPAVKEPEKPTQVGGERITCPCCKAERLYYPGDFHWLQNWARDSTYCKACGQRFCVHGTQACYGCR